MSGLFAILLSLSLSFGISLFISRLSMSIYSHKTFTIDNSKEQQLKVEKPKRTERDIKREKQILEYIRESDNDITEGK
jgi:hypothetical protein